MLIVGDVPLEVGDRPGLMPAAPLSPHRRPHPSRLTHHPVAAGQDHGQPDHDSEVDAVGHERANGSVPRDLPRTRLRLSHDAPAGGLLDRPACNAWAYIRCMAAPAATPPRMGHTDRPR